MKAKPIYDVVLVSAFGRLDPLAIELVQRGMSVALLDLTGGFFNLSWRDVNGPFPMVTPSPALPSHLDWLVARSSTELDRGFSFWLRSGPLELRGSLGTFYSDRNKEVGLLKDYLARRLQSPKPQSVFSRSFHDYPFQSNWLIHLSHALTQNKMTLHAHSASVGSPFPLHQSVQLLRLDEESLKDLRAAAINAGVDHFDDESIDEVRIESQRASADRIQSFELADNSLKAHFFVWGLNQEESFQVCPAIYPNFFRAGAPLLSDWVWRRLELNTTQDLFKAFPDSFLMIQNPEWPWTAENFVLFKKDSEKSWDLWVRVPRAHFEPQTIIDKITQELKERLGSFDGQILNPPEPEFFSHPIYETISMSLLPKPKFKNLIYEAKETGRRSDLAARFESQVDILAEIESWKAKLDKQVAKANKGALSDQSIHSP